MHAKRDEQALGVQVQVPIDRTIDSSRGQELALDAGLSSVTSREALQFFEMSADIMCITGLDGRFRRLNPAFYTILGYDAADVAGRPFIDFVHPEDVGDSHQQFDQLRRDGKAVEFESRYRTASGNYRWLAWTLQRSGDEVVYAIGRDVTDHKRTQADSVERESRIRFLCQITSQSDSDFIASLEEILDFSAAMLEADFAILGRIEGDAYLVEVCAGSGVYLPSGHRLPLEETYCQSVFDSRSIQIVHDVPASPLGRAHAHKVMRLGSYIGIPLVVGGSFYGTLAFYGPVRTEPFLQSDLDFVQLIARWVIDGLDRRAIEAQIERQRRELDSLVDAVPDALVFADTDRSIRLVNVAFTRLFGYTMNDVRGHTTAMIYPSFAEYVAKDSRHFDKEAATKRAEQEESAHPVYPQRYRRADGTVFPSETVASVVHDDAGSPLGYVGVIRDISEQQRWRSELELKAQALERTNEELERFVYVASHDLKAPVRAVGQLVAWIEEDADGGLNAEVRSHLAKITQRIARMEALLTGLLEYARAGVTQDIQVVDMRILLDDIVSMLSTAHACDIAITGAMPLVRTSRIAMEQIFTNLISNAIKHHDHNEGQLPQIELFAHQDGTGWQFVIEDDGPGIPEQDRAGVFEIFKTLQPRDVFESSGVGLAIVRKVIDSLGGRLSLTESSKGRGCRFQVWLPGIDGAGADFNNSADAT